MGPGNIRANNLLRQKTLCRLGFVAGMSMRMQMGENFSARKS
jgi:hypothetical protein